MNLNTIYTTNVWFEGDLDKITSNDFQMNTGSEGKPPSTIELLILFLQTYYIKFKPNETAMDPA